MKPQSSDNIAGSLSWGICPLRKPNGRKPSKEKRMSMMASSKCFYLRISLKDILYFWGKVIQDLHNCKQIISYGNKFRRILRERMPSSLFSQLPAKKLWFPTWQTQEDKNLSSLTVKTNWTTSSSYKASRNKGRHIVMTIWPESFISILD